MTLFSWLQKAWRGVASWFRADVIAVPSPVPAQPVASVTSRKPSIAPLRNEIEDQVTDLTERIASLDISRMADREGGREYEEALADIYACDFHYVSELADRMEGGGKFYMGFDDAADAADIQEASWPLDVAVVTENDDGLIFLRMWTATPESMRGRAKLFPPRVAWLAHATMQSDDTFFCQKMPIGLFNGRWQRLDIGMTRAASHSIRGKLEQYYFDNKDTRAELHDTAMLTQSVALTERYSWHVALGQADGPRVLLPTNPRGCLELFKTRQKREDETRRAALRHWVQQHYREHGDREIAYVRDHLRGTTEFNWRDFDCEIFVSAFDLEKNEFFKQQADEWRAQRKHNRVRVRLKRVA